MTWNDTQGETLSHKCDVWTLCINRRCAACSELRIVHVSVLCGVRAIVRNVLQVVHVVREDVRSLP